jgi:hypothetical protein
MDDSIQVVEEMLVEHHSVLSEPTGISPCDTVYEASGKGGYRSLRELFGLVLMGPVTVRAEMLGEALTTPTHGKAYTGLVRVLRRNFSSLFPQHGDEAFAVFLHEYNECRFGHQAEYVTRRWAELAHEKVMGSVSS